MDENVGDELRELRSEMELGFDLQAFKRHPVGMFLYARAEDMADEALDKLKRADPFTSPELVRDLQNQIKVAETMFIGWIEEAIAQGAMAQTTLTDVAQEG